MEKRMAVQTKWVLDPAQSEPLFKMKPVMVDKVQFIK